MYKCIKLCTSVLMLRFTFRTWAWQFSDKCLHKLQDKNYPILGLWTPVKREQKDFLMKRNIHYIWLILLNPRFETQVTLIASYLLKNWTKYFINASYFVGYFPTSRSSIPFARKGVLYFDPSKTKKNSLDPFPGFSWRGMVTTSHYLQWQSRKVDSHNKNFAQKIW